MLFAAWLPYLLTIFSLTTSHCLISQASFGPPFALIQGTLEAMGNPFKKIPTEVCPTIRRGSVAWIGSGPEFFISLANHEEWKNAYTVFGSVLPEDMKIAEKIAQLPTKPDVWNNINVSVLEQPVPLLLRRIQTSVKTEWKFIPHYTSLIAFCSILSLLWTILNSMLHRSSSVLEK